MLLCQEEFLVLQNVISHVMRAQQIGIELGLNCRTNDTLGRVFDPGNGLQYALFDIIQQEDGRFKLYYKMDLAGIIRPELAGTEVKKLGLISQLKVSAFYELNVLPKCVRKALNSFYEDFSESEIDSGVDEDFMEEGSEHKIVRAFKDRVLEPLFDQLVEKFKAQQDADNALYIGAQPSELARYTIIGLFMNTVSLNEQIVSLKSRLNKAIQTFLQKKFEIEQEKRLTSSTGAFASFASSSLLIIPSKKDYVKLFTQVSEAYTKAEEKYKDARSQRRVSYLRDKFKIRPSHITRLFFSLRQVIEDQTQTAEEKLKFLVCAFNQKLVDSEKDLICRVGRYDAIYDFCKLLQDISKELTDKPKPRILRTR